MKHICLKILASQVFPLLFLSIFLSLSVNIATGQIIPQAIQPIVSLGQSPTTTPVSPTWQNGNSNLCTTAPIPLAKPYIGFNGIANERQARTAWCSAISKQTLSLYCDSLSIQLRSVQVWTMGPDCQAAVLKRQQEYNEILSFLNL